MQIQNATPPDFGDADSPLRSSLRSSLRLTRTSLFLAETLARHAVDGASQCAHESARELSWLAENVTALSGVRPHIIGQLPQEPCVIVANHVSYLDPLVLASLVACVPVAKSELRDWPVLGKTARSSNVLFVRRECALSGARVLREAKRALDAGISVLVFPEGTTTSGQHVLPFKRGALGLAQLAQVPIVPVALSYTHPEAAWIGEETFLPHFARTLARPFTPVSVHFLPAIHPQREHSAESLAHEARGRIVHALRTKPRASARVRPPLASARFAFA